MPHGDAGSAMIEVAVWCALLVGVIMRGDAAIGLIDSGRSDVEQAAWSAARAASLQATPAEAERAAQQTTAATLAQAGRACRDPHTDVDTSAFRAGGQVNVTVSCHTDLSSLTIPGIPGTVTLSARGTAYLEQHRQLPTPTGAP